MSFVSRYPAIGISIHALREEGDIPGGATRRKSLYFYPRPPRGGRRQQVIQLGAHGRNFYPRPPRGGRLTASTRRCSMALFLSTPSARRATWNQLLDQQDRKISIHALREEGDRA